MRTEGYGGITTALLAAMAVLALTASAQARGFYLSTFGGANFDDVAYSSDWISAKDSAGYIVGGAVGTTITSLPGLGIEAELAYRSNGIDILVCEEGLTATDRTWSLMANARYRFLTQGWPVHPYVLVGAGYASRTASLDAYPGELSNQGVAYQAGVGATTMVADGVHLGLEYRVADLPDLDLYDFHSDGIDQSVLATATFTFD